MGNLIDDEQPTREFVIKAKKLPAVHAAVHTVCERRGSMFVETGNNHGKAATKQLQMIY
jgi:hypothetical protein